MRKPNLRASLIVSLLFAGVAVAAPAPANAEPTQADHHSSVSTAATAQERPSPTVAWVCLWQPGIPWQWQGRFVVQRQLGGWVTYYCTRRIYNHGFRAWVRCHPIYFASWWTNLRYGNAVVSGSSTARCASLEWPVSWGVDDVEYPWSG